MHLIWSLCQSRHRVSVSPTVPLAVKTEDFRTAGHLASWAGLSPGSYESAGKKKSSRVTRGNKYLKTALVTSGGMAGRSRDPAFGSLYHRVAGSIKTSMKNNKSE